MVVMNFFAFVYDFFIYMSFTSFLPSSAPFSLVATSICCLVPRLSPLQVHSFEQVHGDHHGLSQDPTLPSGQLQDMTSNTLPVGGGGGIGGGVEQAPP